LSSLLTWDPPNLRRSQPSLASSPQDPSEGSLLSLTPADARDDSDRHRATPRPVDRPLSAEANRVRLPQRNERGARARRSILGRRSIVHLKRRFHGHVDRHIALVSQIHIAGIHEDHIVAIAWRDRRGLAVHVRNVLR